MVGHRGVPVHRHHVASPSRQYLTSKETGTRKGRGRKTLAQEDTTDCGERRLPSTPVVPGRAAAVDQGAGSAGPAWEHAKSVALQRPLPDGIL